MYLVKWESDNSKSSLLHTWHETFQSLFNYSAKLGCTFQVQKPKNRNTLVGQCRQSLASVAPLISTRPGRGWGGRLNRQTLGALTTDPPLSSHNPQFGLAKGISSMGFVWRGKCDFGSFHERAVDLLSIIIKPLMKLVRPEEDHQNCEKNWSWLQLHTDQWKWFFMFGWRRRWLFFLLFKIEI